MLSFRLLALLGLAGQFVHGGVDLRPNCGYPGKPYRAKIAPEEKLVYADGETVSYSCTDYWAAPQERKCVKGLWTGPLARCGKWELTSKKGKRVHFILKVTLSRMCS